MPWTISDNTDPEKGNVDLISEDASAGEIECITFEPYGNAIEGRAPPWVHVSVRYGHGGADERAAVSALTNQNFSTILSRSDAQSSTISVQWPMTEENNNYILNALSLVDRSIDENDDITNLNIKIKDKLTQLLSFKPKKRAEWFLEMIDRGNIDSCFDMANIMGNAALAELANCLTSKDKLSLALKAYQSINYWEDSSITGMRIYNEAKNKILQAVKAGQMDVELAFNYAHNQAVSGDNYIWFDLAEILKENGLIFEATQAYDKAALESGVEEGAFDDAVLARYVASGVGQVDEEKKHESINIDSDNHSLSPVESEHFHQLKDGDFSILDILRVDINYHPDEAMSAQRQNEILTAIKKIKNNLHKNAQLECANLYLTHLDNKEFIAKVMANTEQHFLQGSNEEDPSSLLLEIALRHAANIKDQNLARIIFRSMAEGRVWTYQLFKSKNEDGKDIIINPIEMLFTKENPLTAKNVEMAISFLRNTRVRQLHDQNKQLEDANRELKKQVRKQGLEKKKVASGPGFYAHDSTSKPATKEKPKKVNKI